MECSMIARPHGNKNEPSSWCVLQCATGRAGPERPVSNGPVRRVSHPTQAEAVTRDTLPPQAAGQGRPLQTGAIPTT